MSGDRVPDQLVDLLRAASGGAPPERALAALTELRGRLDALEATAAAEAVASGASWARIGDALGITRQAAHRRHAARIREPPERSAPGLVITRDARQTVEYARAEARALRSPDVRPEHLLLGLLRGRRGPAADALGGLGVSLADARDALDRVYAGGGLKRPERTVAPPPEGRLPVSPQARQAFEQALREAVALGHGHLGVEHVLLALLRHEGSPAAAMLAELGVGPDEVEKSVQELGGGEA